MPKCLVEPCTEQITKDGHKLCYKHWKAEKAGQLKQCRQCKRWVETTHDVCDSCTDSALEDATADLNQAAGPLSSTKLGEHFQLPTRRINLLLAELGWIEKHIKGWKLSDRGQSIGGMQREARQTGIPYVVWQPAILTNKILLDAIKESRASENVVTTPTSNPAINQTPQNQTPNSTAMVPPITPSPTSNANDFRSKYPANFRATDGHFVRSRAELLIDNWLYMQNIAHAYERKLPIEEDALCDFYLPKGKVYIEFWGLEKDPKYAARMAEKRDIYKKHNLNLIELSDAEITNLDDVLPRLLLKYEIDCT